MAQPDRQENTSRRSLVVDADYVLQSEEPNQPRVAESTGEHAGPAGFVVAGALVVLALAVAAYGAGPGRPEPVERGAAGEMVFAAFESGIYPEQAAEDDSPLGLEAETVSAAVAAYYSEKDCPAVPGAKVCAVSGDGAAARAGVATGDVITAVGDREIRTAAELYAAAADLGAEGKVPITVYRDGEYLTLLAELPSPEG